MKTLEEMTVKELRAEAKKLKIVGYSTLRKHNIICLIIEKKKELEKEFAESLGKLEEVKETKSDYIERIEVNSLIAFRVGRKVISGKVKQIGNEKYLIETKNGNTFMISKEDIVWVRTGKRWPKFVYNMLKGINENESKGSKEISC